MTGTILLVEDDARIADHSVKGKAHHAPLAAFQRNLFYVDA